MITKTQRLISIYHHVLSWHFSWVHNMAKCRTPS